MADFFWGYPRAACIQGSADVCVRPPMPCYGMKLAYKCKFYAMNFKMESILPRLWRDEWAVLASFTSSGDEIR